MHHKHETQNHLSSFLAFIQTQFHTKGKQIRVDNGGEFASMKQFLVDSGIVYQHSCFYTSQQNGVVERKHCHILGTTRVLRFQAQLPLHF